MFQHLPLPFPSLSVFVVFKYQIPTGSGKYVQKQNVFAFRWPDIRFFFIVFDPSMYVHIIALSSVTFLQHRAFFVLNRDFIFNLIFEFWVLILSCTRRRLVAIVFQFWIVSTLPFYLFVEASKVPKFVSSLEMMCPHLPIVAVLVLF